MLTCLHSKKKIVTQIGLNSILFVARLFWFQIVLNYY